MAIPWLDVGKSLVTRPDPLWKRWHSEESGVYCTLLFSVGTRPMIGCYTKNLCRILFLVTLFRLGRNMSVVTYIARTFAPDVAGLCAQSWRIRVMFTRLCLWCLNATVSFPTWFWTTPRSNPWGNSDANAVSLIAIWLILSLICPGRFLLRGASRSSRNNSRVNLYLLAHPKFFGTTALS